jgi:hypothetical protein
MGDRLLVDLDALDDTATELYDLSTEFRNATHTVDEARAAIGNARVVDAMDEFAHNWRRHRDGLVKSLDAVASMARDSHDTYVDCDDKLAADLKEKTR